MTATAALPDPWGFVVHPVAEALVLAAWGAWILAVRRVQPGPIPRRNRLTALAGVACLLVAVSWPLADLARRYSFLAHMAQTLLVCLAAPGLILSATPRSLLARITRSTAVDSVVRQVVRPAVAFVAFNAVVVVSQLPPVVAAEARSSWWQGLADAALFAAGTVLWAPALRALPGSRPASAAGRGGYLFAQSLIPNFVSLAYIFARHSFYPVLAPGTALLGIHPLVDQQLAGALAKIVGVFVLWGSAVALILRASRIEEAGLDPEPLTWDEVDRELRRLDRRGRHVEPG